MSYHHTKLIVRITVLGSKSSGKSTLVNAYIKRDFTSDKYGKMNDAAHRHEAVIEGKNVTHQILDSDGKNSAVTAWAHGVIVVFSVADAESFKEAEKHINFIKEITMRDANIMLVGNKVDLGKREVSLEEGQKLASALRCNYAEVSAQYDEDKAKSIFYELSHEILQKRGLMNKLNYRRTPNMVRRVFQALTNNTRDRRSMTFL